MIWKSAPNAQTLPLTPSPRTSPPVIGMMRRTPWPISPTDVTPPIWAVMVKTYFVSSTGAMDRPNLRGKADLVHHALRQPGRQQRKRDQYHQPHQVGRHERDHALEDGGKGHVLDHALDDEDVHTDRRMDQAEFHRHHDDDAEPDRVEAEMGNHREDDRHRQ